MFKDQRPLAERMRPHEIDDLLGQKHLLGQGAPLRTAIESGVVPSMILWVLPEWVKPP